MLIKWSVVAPSRVVNRQLRRSEEATNMQLLDLIRGTLVKHQRTSRIEDVTTKRGKECVHQCIHLSVYSPPKL